MIKKISARIYFIFIITINSFASITNPYNIVNNNEPYFTKEEKQYLIPFENYSELDELGRCGPAKALICEEIMPKKNEKRKDISKVIPTGWTYNKKSNNNKYDFIPGKYIYNRCHLIAYSLSGENDNKLNIITGTRSLNIQGMYEFEQDILSYCKKTKNHVLYRVTPEFENDEVMARSVLMEGYSIEDQGEGICFCIRAWNNEDGIEINYKTGENWIQQTNPEITETLPNIEENIQNYENTITTQDITQTLDLYKESELLVNETTIQQDIKEGIYVFKIIFPIIIATSILIFVVLFTGKILEKPKNK